MCFSSKDSLDIFVVLCYGLKRGADSIPKDLECCIKHRMKRTHTLELSSIFYSKVSTMSDTQQGKKELKHPVNAGLFNIQACICYNPSPRWREPETSPLRALPNTSTFLSTSMSTRSSTTWKTDTRVCTEDTRLRSPKHQLCPIISPGHFHDSLNECSFQIKKTLEGINQRKRNKKLNYKKKLFITCSPLHWKRKELFFFSRVTGTLPYVWRFQSTQIYTHFFALVTYLRKKCKNRICIKKTSRFGARRTERYFCSFNCKKVPEQHRLVRNGQYELHAWPQPDRSTELPQGKKGFFIIFAH
jgi:hypothetical protein